MNFMLDEYDALPFGLLRRGKVESPHGVAEEAPKFVHCCPDPGQKVMPLDKVGMHAREDDIPWRYRLQGCGMLDGTNRMCAR